MRQRFIHNYGSALGITITKLPRSVSNGAVTLRLYRFRDLPALSMLFTPEVLGKAYGGERRPFHSFFSFCTWLFTTFQLFYVIQAGEPRGRRIVGFVGLYGLDIGRSLQVSIGIFHPADRRRGYGHQALTLLLRALQNNRVVQTVGVEVLKGNAPSLRFCQNLGFVVRGQNAQSFILERALERRE